MKSRWSALQYSKNTKTPYLDIVTFLRLQYHTRVNTSPGTNGENVHKICIQAL